MIDERLDMVPANKQIGFFSDAYCVEWAYGKWLLVRHLLAGALAARVERGQYSVDEALSVARTMLYEAPQSLVGMVPAHRDPMTHFVTQPIPEHKPPTRHVERPWGTFEQYAFNQPVTVSLMTVQPGQRLSLQAHSGRAELWIVLDEGAEVRLATKPCGHRPATSCGSRPIPGTGSAPRTRPCGCWRWRTATGSRRTLCGLATTTRAPRPASKRT